MRYVTDESPSLRLRLEACAESAALMRERLSLWLEELGATAEAVFDFTLAATEAFANAVEHPHEPTANVIEVDGDVVDSTAKVTVRDFGSWGNLRVREEGGYGFEMMRKLVDAVEVARGPLGTSITLRRRIDE